MTDRQRQPGADGRTYYFGTRPHHGHWLYDEDRRQLDTNNRFGPEFRWISPLPWHSIDGKLNPSAREGECAVHHRAGWTALAFANYTDDRRPGSNSVFFFEGTLSFDQAVEAARRRWPDIVEKFDFDLWDTANPPEIETVHV